MMMQSDDGGAEAGEGHDLFLSAPASPVHYILRSPPASSSSSTATAGDCGGAGHGAGAGDFEFLARAPAGGMSSAEELFVAGRIRVGGGCLAPMIRQEEEAGREDQGSGDDEREGRDGGRAAPRTRRARSASPPRAATGAEPSPRPSASSTSSSPSPSPSSSSTFSLSSSSSAKNTRRRISLRDLLAGTSGDGSGKEQGADTTAGAGTSCRSGFWPPSIWPSRSNKKKALLPPCPAPLPGRLSTSSDRAAPGCGARRTTSLPDRQGLVLGCLSFGARSYGLASKSMHPLYSP